MIYNEGALGLDPYPQRGHHALVRHGVGDFGVASAVIAIGGQLLNAGLSFGTVAYQAEMQRRLQRLSHDQQIELLNRQSELERLLRQQAAEHGQVAAQQTTSTIKELAPWGIAALGLLLLLR